MTPKRIVETRELKVTQGSDRGLLGWKVIEAFQAIAARYTTRNRHPGFGYQVSAEFAGHRPKAPRQSRAGRISPGNPVAAPCGSRSAPKARSRGSALAVNYHTIAAALGN
jgi:hypothetical protein